MHINQQQMFEYSIMCRLQNLLPKSTHCHYTDWNIKYLSIYISLVATKWLLVLQVVRRVMIRTRASVKKAHVCPLPYTMYFLHAGPISMSISQSSVSHFDFINTDELGFMLIDPQALIWI